MSPDQAEIKNCPPPMKEKQFLIRFLDCTKLFTTFSSNTYSLLQWQLNQHLIIHASLDVLDDVAFDPFTVNVHFNLLDSCILLHVYIQLQPRGTTA